MEIDKEIILRFFDICPSLIALIIALLTPLINKKLDIEKNEVQFYLQKNMKYLQSILRSYTSLETH